MRRLQPTSSRLQRGPSNSDRTKPIRWMQSPKSDALRGVEVARELRSCPSEGTTHRPPRVMHASCSNAGTRGRNERLLFGDSGCLASGHDEKSENRRATGPQRTFGQPSWSRETAAGDCVPSRALRSKHLYPQRSGMDGETRMSTSPTRARNVREQPRGRSRYITRGFDGAQKP